MPLPIARELFEHYRQGAAEAGREVTPDKLGFLLCAVAADTKEKAMEAGRNFEWRMGPTTRGPVEYFAPPGMRTRAGQQMALRTRPPNMINMTYEEKVENDLIVAGTPDYLVERFEHFRRELGIGHLLLQGHESKMDAPTTWRSIELIGQKVFPPSPNNSEPHSYFGQALSRSIRRAPRLGRSAPPKASLR